MNQNVGTLDRIVRIAIGVMLLAAAAFVESGARWFGLIGVIPLLTGFFGTCPLYTLVGVSTCTTPKRRT